MKYIRKVLMLGLALCITLTLLPLYSSAETTTESSGWVYGYVDAGGYVTDYMEIDKACTMRIYYDTSYPFPCAYLQNTTSNIEHDSYDTYTNDGDDMEAFRYGYTVRYTLKPGKYRILLGARESAPCGGTYRLKINLTYEAHTCSFKKDKVVAPTCSERGYTRYVCSCGNTKKDNYVDKLPHTEAATEEIPATCQKTGQTAGVQCSVCEIVISGCKMIPKADHTYADNVCIYCGTLTGSCGTDLKWTLDGEGKLTVTGTGDMYNYEIFDGPWEDYCDRITSVSLPDGLTSIGSFAFQYLQLPRITIPTTVTSIGEGAFWDCKNLTEISIPDSVTFMDGFTFTGCTALGKVKMSKNLTELSSYTFSECSALKVVAIPNNVTRLGNGVFSDCTMLSSLTIPKNVTSIGDNLFENCTSLTEISLPDGITVLPEQPFLGCTALTTVGLPENITSIPDQLFLGCTALTTVTLPKNITSIPEQLFSGCTALTHVTIPEGVTSIGSDAFYDCAALTKVNIPASVTAIGEYAFYNCTSLAEVRIAAAVTSIGRQAFSGCSGLALISIAGDAPAIGAGAFKDITATIHYNAAASGWEEVVTQGYGGSISWDTESHVFEITEVVKPTCTEQGYTIYTCPCGLQKLDDYTEPKHQFNSDYICSVCKIAGEAGNGIIWTYDEETATLTFSGEKSMNDYVRSSWSRYAGTVKRVVIEEGITEICTKAFQNFYALEEITVAESVTSVGVNAFQNCTNLREFTSNVTYVWRYAFSGCKNLRKVVLSDAVIGIDEYAFRYCNNLESIQFSGNLKTIGDYAFFGCYNLKEITIPDKVVRIGEGAFAYCKSLTELILPSSLKGWGADAFDDCSSLKTVTINSYLSNNYAESAFTLCENLEYVFFTDTGPSTNEDWFAGTPATGYYPSNDKRWEEYIEVFGWKACLYLEPYDPCNTHSFGEWKETTAPTCTTVGVETRHCSGCVYFRTRPISKLPHTWDEGVVTPPTCTEQGYTTFTCSCGETKRDNVVEALGHAWDSGTVKREATEESTGQMLYTCTVCEKTKTEEIPKLEHTHKYTPKITLPTCTEQGYTTYTCPCAHSYKDDYVEAPGHKWDEGVVVTEPTEEAEGLRGVTCTVCDAYETQSIPKLEHVHRYESAVVEPTCTEKGFTTHTCACGHSYTDAEVPATGHSFGEWSTVTAPTCTEAGQEKRTCSACDHAETRDVAAKGHSYTDDVTVPTCTEKGFTTHTCACGHSYTDAEVPATGHSGGAATCQVAAVCTACGTAYGEKNPANHAGGTEIRGAVDATEFTEGYTGDTHCAGCGELLTKGQVIPASHAHSYGDWKSDSAEHWHECTCGDLQDKAAHAPGPAATETTPQVCTICGYELSPVLDVHTHTLIKIEAVDATHDAPGNSEYYTCACGKWFADAEGAQEIENHDSVILPALSFAYGDVNHDGDIKISDAILVMKYRAGNLSEGDTFCERCANVKGEGAINIQSAILIMKKRANQNMLFPVELQ